MSQQRYERDELLKDLDNCEKSMQECSVEMLSELRHRFKQLKEKLRSMDYYDRMKSGEDDIPGKAGERSDV